MKKVILLFLVVCSVTTLMAQQQILLLTETFENSNNTFTLNGAGVGANSGSNAWVINNQYNGQPTYINTPSQDSVVSGQISNAPFSNYLHIHDQTAAPAIANANWNSNNASDRFTFLGGSFCTLGMTNVTFAFFWVGEGNADAYGEVYYRKNGGAWTKTGLAKYNNQSKWKYEVIQDAAFDNAENVQVGFRWVNNSGGASNISFGIDDIIAVGTYDNVTNPVKVNINLLIPTTVCQGNFLTIGYSLSQPLCDGTYRIQMSNASGSFASPIDGGVFNINAPDTVGFIGFQVPNNVQGNCFRIRINRISPEPLIIGDTSICFTINDCPETIFTNNAPVMVDADTTCIKSVIDVKFNSIGVFGPGTQTNTYTAQLSDANGSFANPYTLGTLVSDEAFPGPPGNVSGLIPANVPPGCGYFIRVVSNFPAAVGNVIGPFCLTQCDVLTNNTQDIKVCLNGSTPFPADANIQIKINEWNTNASYDTCNDWTIELRSMMDFSLVNSGGLGVYKDSLGGSFFIDFPVYEQQLVALGINPGAYYLRILSDCSNLPWNQTGSVIRITIGAPDTLRPRIILADTVSCNVGLVGLTVNPFNNPPSSYEWASSGLNNGNAFVWPTNPLLVDFTGAPLGDYIFYVREINFGCTGSFSDKAVLTIIGNPNVNISGPVQVCLGDTVTYNVGFLKETFYNWDAPPGVTILDESNSQVTMIFDTLGTFTISNFSLNDCGGDSGTYQVKVITLYEVEAGADTTLCAGQPLRLNAQTDFLNKVFLTQDTAKVGRQGAMFNIYANDDVIIDSIAVKVLPTPQQVQAEIYGKSGTYKNFETDFNAWTQLGTYFNFPAATNGLTVIPIPLNQPINKGDTYAFYVTSINQTPVNFAYGNGTGAQETVFKTDGIIDFIQGTVNNYPFGTFVANAPRVLNARIYYSTKSGLKYSWSTGDTTATLLFAPQQSGIYSVVVFDTSGCKNKDSLNITVLPSPAVNAGPDTTICPDLDYLLQGSSSSTAILWTPSNGLSATDILQPTATISAASEYVLSATGSNGCVNSDTVRLATHSLPLVVVGSDTALCIDATYQFAAQTDAQSFVWSPVAGLSDATVLNPVFSAPQGNTYTLLVTDSLGCQASASVKVDVVICESWIKAPEAFTPNSDGVNDFFTVFAKNIAEYQIRIFNRWGEVVYESTDESELNVLTRGWDGTYKGKLQSLNTFVYQIIAKDVNGLKIEKAGNLTLIQ